MYAVPKPLRARKAEREVKGPRPGMAVRAGLQTQPPLRCICLLQGVPVRITVPEGQRPLWAHAEAATESESWVPRSLEYLEPGLLLAAVTAG